MTPAQLTILKTELTTDPLARGYAAIIDKHAKLAKLFEPTDRPNSVNNDTTTGGAVASAIVPADLASIVTSPANQLYLTLLCAAGTLDLVGQSSGLKGSLKTLFPAGTPTRTNLTSLFKRDGTRADELGIPQPTASDVADALRS